MLAHAYSKTGRFAEAMKSERQALDLVVREHDQEVEKNLRENLKLYEQQAGNAHTR